MKFDLTATSRLLRGRFVRHAWTTSRQKRVTTGVVFGMIVALLLPGFGIAALGGAIAGWLIALPLFAVLGGLAGGHFATRNELGVLKRQVERDKRPV